MDPPTLERMSATAWQRPPGDVLGHPVPIQQFVARTDQAVVALRDVIAFREGCSLSLHMVIRRGSLYAPPKNPLSRHIQTQPPTSPRSATPISASFLPVSRAPPPSTAPSVASPPNQPPEPLIVDDGGEDSRGAPGHPSDLRHWRSPLPPPALPSFSR